jgi:hypothetical protein
LFKKLPSGHRGQEDGAEARGPGDKRLFILGFCVANVDNRWQLVHQMTFFSQKATTLADLHILVGRQYHCIDQAASGRFFKRMLGANFFVGAN